MIGYMHISRFSADILCGCFLFATICLAAMAQFRAFQYLFFIGLLKHQLNVVEKEAKSLADASENGTVSKERLRWFRTHYDLVYELSSCINEVFGWSNLVSFSYFFLRLALDLIWNYSNIIRKIGMHIEGTPGLRILTVAVNFHQNCFRCPVDHSYNFAACLSIQRDFQMRHQGDSKCIPFELNVCPASSFITFDSIIISSITWIASKSIWLTKSWQCKSNARRCSWCDSRSFCMPRDFSSSTTTLWWRYLDLE